MTGEVTGPRQLVLDLPTRPSLGRAEFYVSPANELALAQVERWPDWTGGRLAVVGPEGAGKTHLVHVWAARAGGAIIAAETLEALDLASLAPEAAIAIEDADRGLGTGGEETLFHLCNRLATGGSLLVTGREAPARWPLRLPDLRSRMEATEVARLDAPDDALLAAVLVKLFADRQLPVAPGLIQYLVSRMDRSFAAAVDLVGALDRAGLAGRRAITARLAAEVLFGDG